MDLEKISFLADDFLASRLFLASKVSLVDKIIQ